MTPLPQNAGYGARGSGMIFWAGYDICRVLRKMFVLNSTVSKLCIKNAQKERLEQEEIMKKLFAILMAAIMMLGALSGCGKTQDLEAGLKEDGGASDTQEGGDAPDAQEEQEPAGGAKVGVILTTSGLGDNNFNDMVYAGLEQAKADLGITFDYAEPASPDEYTSMTYDFAQDGSYDLIIVLSSDGATALDEIAPRYPDQKFTLVDNASDNPNVCNILKNGAEQIFLTGVIAGLLTVDDRMEYANAEKKVGAIQGIDTATLNSMSTGFACGARFYDPEVEVLVSTVGSFTDVNTGKEMSVAMYDQGVDVIQNLAGSGSGIWSALEEKHFYGIGCGANQNGMSPYIVATAGFVLTSLVYQQCQQIIDSTWTAGNQYPSFADGAFEYLLDGASVELPEDLIEKVEAAREWYMSSGVELPTTMDEVDAWIAANGQAG